MRLKRTNHPGQLGLALSKNNIIEMKKILEDMSIKELPNVDGSVNLDPQLFKEVLQRYILGCKSVLDLMDPDVNPDLPLDANNLQLQQKYEILISGMPLQELPPPASSSFFKPVLDAGKMLDNLATAKLGESVQAALSVSAIALAKQLSSTATADPLTLPIPATFENIQLMQKNPNEMSEIIASMMVLGSGVALAAAAFIYCVWKKAHKRNTQSYVSSSNNPMNASDVTIEVFPQSKSYKLKR